MRLLAELTAVLTLFALQTSVWAGVEESPEAYRIASATAVTLLPPPLRAFFETHLEDVQHAATAGLDPGRTSEAALPGRPDWHYVMLDAAADEPTAEARRAAARAFPHDQRTAAKLLRKHGHGVGGSLPWVIRDRHGMMVEAFRNGKVEAIVQEAGVVLHFATDAALPFNTTTDRDGAATGHLRWSAASGASHTTLSHRTVRHRVHLGFIRRAYERLKYEVRVAPDRYGPITDPVDAAFDVLFDTHREAQALLRFDAEIMAELGITDAKSFAASMDAYYDRLSNLGGPIVEARLEAGALLGAVLVGDAWVEAGRPLPRTWEIAPPSADTSATSEESRTAPFVGSRFSTVFHRADCSHAKRIKPTNRIYFETVQEAGSAGRTPCRLCDPAEPGDSP